MENKQKVFVITPFDENFLALYDELKNNFEDDFERKYLRKTSQRFSCKVVYFGLY